VDGLLLIDKPAGPTSHDVVLRLRKSSGERRVGHTGTLDPRATGLLPLVFGRATRLASLIAGGDKTYEAVIRLGVATDTDDADGRPLGEVAASLPASAAVEAALAAFRGTFDQLPPSHSAKKVAGQKAYDLARREKPVDLAPAAVTVRALEVLGHEADLMRIRVTATSGFYVRALARDLGTALGCGAHLHALRRTGSGAFDVAQAMPLEQAEALRQEVAGRLLSPLAALPDLAAVTLTETGLKRALHGNSLGPEHLEGRVVPAGVAARPVRVVGPDGRLVALAHARGGALHPVVVLG
jgi:tRNA pseudouridine55 synthase